MLFLSIVANAVLIYFACTHATLETSPLYGCTFLFVTLPWFLHTLADSDPKLEEPEPVVVYTPVPVKKPSQAEQLAKGAFLLAKYGLLELQAATKEMHRIAQEAERQSAKQVEEVQRAEEAEINLKGRCGVFGETKRNAK